MTDWNAFAERCLAAPEPDSDLARDIARELMHRDDYPTVGTLVSGAVAVGRTDAAFEIVSILFPGWGCQVGHPLRTYAPHGWYASVFRERTPDEANRFMAGNFAHDGRSETKREIRYAAHPALAIMAAVCRVLDTTGQASAAA